MVSENNQKQHQFYTVLDVFLWENRGVCATHDLRLGALTVAGLPAHGTSNLQGVVVGKHWDFLAIANFRQVFLLAFFAYPDHDQPQSQSNAWHCFFFQLSLVISCLVYSIIFLLTVFVFVPIAEVSHPVGYKRFSLDGTQLSAPKLMNSMDEGSLGRFSRGHVTKNTLFVDLPEMFWQVVVRRGE